MKGGLLRGSTLGMFSQAWHMAAALLLYAYLARILGPVRFGDWRLTLTVLSWFEVFVTAGIAKVATKSLAQGSQDGGSVARAAYLDQLALGLVVSAVLVAASGPIARGLGDPRLAILLRFAALDVAPFALFIAASSIVLGSERYERQAIAWFVYGTSKALLVGALASGVLSVRGALIGNALSSVVGLTVMAVPLVRRGPEAASVRWLARGMLLSAAPFLVLALLEALNMNADIWVLSAIARDRSFVGIYAAAMLFSDVPVFLFVGLNRVLFPSVARACARGDTVSADRYTALSVRAALAVSIFGLAIAASAGRQVLTLLFSRAYVGAALPLTLLMAAGVGRTVLATGVDVLMAQGRMRASLTSFITTVAVEVALVAILAPGFGPVGAAAGAAIAAGLGATYVGLALRGALGTGPVVTVVRCSVAATAACVSLHLLPLQSVWLIPAIAAALIAYVGLLRWTGEVTAEDLTSVRVALGRTRSEAEEAALTA